MSLDSGRKLECLEGTHTDTERTHTQKSMDRASTFCKATQTTTPLSLFFLGVTMLVQSIQWDLSNLSGLKIQKQQELDLISRTIKGYPSKPSLERIVAETSWNIVWRPCGSCILRTWSNLLSNPFQYCPASHLSGCIHPQLVAGQHNMSLCGWQILWSNTIAMAGEKNKLWNVDDIKIGTLYNYTILWLLYFNV